MKRLLFAFLMLVVGLQGAVTVSPSTFSGVTTVTVSWSGLGTSCSGATYLRLTATPPFSTIYDSDFTASGSQGISINVTTTFALKCYYMDGPSEVSVYSTSVTATLVNAHPYFTSLGPTSFHTIPTTISISVNSDGCSSWSLQKGASTIVSNSSAGTWSGTSSVSASTVFTLICSSYTTEGYVTYAPPASIGSFSISPTSISTGGSSTITYACTGSSQATITDSISGSLGSIPISGNRSITPASTRNYTLFCKNTYDTNGATSSPITVTVGSLDPVVASWGISPTSIIPGSSVTLSWTCTNSTSAQLWDSVLGTWYATGLAVSSTRNETPVSSRSYKVKCVGTSISVESSLRAVTLTSRRSFTLILNQE